MAVRVRQVAGLVLVALLGCIAPAFAQTPYRDAVLAADPVDYWRLNEASGNVVSLADGLAECTVSGATYGQGALNADNAASSLSFDGTNDSVDCGDVHDFDGTAPFSVVLLGQRGTVGSGFDRVISKEVTNGSGTQGWWIGINQSTGVINFTRRLNSTNHDKFSTTTVAAGTVYHVAAVYDGADLRLYVNGVEEGSAVSSSASVINHAAALRFGGRSDGSNFWSGQLSDVALYDSALSAATVAALYDAVDGTTDAPGGGGEGDCHATTFTELDDCLDALEADPQCGWRITLEPPLQFEGTTVLRNVGDCGANPNILDSSAAAGNLPDATTRTGPAYSAYLPKLYAQQIAPAENNPALRIELGANGWIVRNIEFWPGWEGEADLIQAGSNDTDQDLRNEQPQNIYFDRIYCNGAGHPTKPYLGFKKCINGNAKNLVVRYSSCRYAYSPIPGGADSGCFSYLNGDGPWTVYGSETEGGTYGVITGGATHAITTDASFSGSPTTTGGDVTWTSGTGEVPFVGDSIGMWINGGTAACHGWITGVSAVTGTSATLAWDTDADTPGTQGCSVAPDAPGKAEWGVLVTGVTVERNFIWHRSDWLTGGSIVPPPAAADATPTTGGSLTAGDYDVYVVASAAGRHGITYWSEDRSAGEITVASSGQIDLTWSAVTAATGYRAYYERGGSWFFVAFSAGATSGSITAEGTGASGLPTAHIAKIKQGFELKEGVDVSFRHNLMRHITPTTDTGHAIWIKTVNQDPCRDSWLRTRNVAIEHNYLEHVGGFILFDGVGDNACDPWEFPVLVEFVTVKHNVVVDSNNGWSHGTVRAINISDGCAWCVFDHNTIDHTSSTALLIASTSRGSCAPGFSFTNNLMYATTNGVRDADGIPSSAEGRLDENCPGWVAFTKNVFAGAPGGSGPATSTYPAGNLFPVIATHEAEFEDHAGFDLRLTTTSTYRNAGTDGENLGADVEAVLVHIEDVESGEFGEAAMTPPRRSTNRFSLMGAGGRGRP